MKVVGRKVPIIVDEARLRPTKSEVQVLLCNHDRASRVMNWLPRVSLEAGLERAARFIRDHLDLYRPEEYAV